MSKPDPHEKNESREHGFTLLEIMAVVMIIGLLMTAIGTAIWNRVGGAKADIARLQVNKVAQALELYSLDNGSYPSSEQGLEALVHEPTSEPKPRRYPPGGYLKAKDLRDPWGNPFKYERPGKNNAHSFDVYTLGEDGLAGGEGNSADAGNWELPSTS